MVLTWKEFEGKKYKDLTNSDFSNQGNEEHLNCYITSRPKKSM